VKITVHPSYRKSLCLATLSIAKLQSLQAGLSYGIVRLDVGETKTDDACTVYLMMR
jgi:hypothetical protein